MDSLDNTSNPVSHLPQPARQMQPSPTKALNELSASANNARINVMPPPPLHGQKRYASALPEPAAKRKTLAERAGEPLKQDLPAPHPKTAASPNITNGPSFSHARNISSSSSTTSRTASSTSRSTSNTSFSASLGHAARPPSQSISSLARPKSSLAKDKSSKLAESRPATSLGNHGGILAQAKRMTHISLRPPDRTVKPMTKNPYYVPKGLPLITPPRPPRAPGVQYRDLSISSALQELTLEPRTPPETSNGRQSPSKLPRLTPAAKLPSTPVTVMKSSRASPKKYLTKDSIIEAWDPNEQYDNIERMYRDTCINFKESLNTQLELKETNQVYQATIRNLEQKGNSLAEQIIALRSELESTKYCLATAEKTKEEIKRDLEEENEDLKRQHRMEAESIRLAMRKELDQSKADHREELREMKKRLEDDIEVERSQRIQAMSQASTQGALEKQKQQLELEGKEQEIRSLQAEIERANAALDREKMLNDDLRGNLSVAGTNAVSMEAARQALQAKIEYLESDSKSQSEAYADMERRMNAALERATECENRLRQEETKRKKLHNQVQELKGNIRVFCRVRPLLNDGDGDEIAKMSFPDKEESKDIEVKGPEETSSLGKVITKSHPFTFDRVFDPASKNAEIFDEISQLIQSALDGFNVCIFAYGQTGSGKTYTMSSEDGMIPLALRQIYTTSKELEPRGWQYSMEGSFVEVYNEELRDLLGNETDADKPKKHEIRHDPLKHETTITDVTTVTLDSQDQVEGLLTHAMSRRSVAATNANERSSRSHSVFILKLVGHNTVTGESIKGTLNLVDLAGSERLAHSKVEGARLKETQNINKSLSCLGDVIGALGQQQAGTGTSFDGRSSVTGSSGAPGGGAHIPYRNSKLTYLLQFSLGGNSKTLMFVMVAPEKKCLSETITSLKFAEKVSRTRIGVARKSR